MSSENDVYHHLLIQAQPKSILKKSPSPKFFYPLINSENDCHSNPILSSTYDTEKNDIDQINTSNEHVCILNDNQSVKEDTSIEVPLNKLIMTSNENSCQYEIDSPLIRTNYPVDSSSSSSSPLTSDDEQQKQQRIRIKSKKNYYRPFAATGTLSSSSDNNDERQAKQSMEEFKTTLIRSNNHKQKDMQLDEFMRKYQQHGGVPLPFKEDPDKKQITTKFPINHHQSSLMKQQISHVNKESMSNDTITLSSKSLSPSQFLFDVARLKQINRRTKIDQIRQYVEEQIGISTFLTIYKLIKSSKIPINIREKPFCYYANFIPHLCCLIILESEQKKINSK